MKTKLIIALILVLMLIACSGQNIDLDYEIDDPGVELQVYDRASLCLGFADGVATFYYLLVAMGAPPQQVYALAQQAYRSSEFDFGVEEMNEAIKIIDKIIEENHRDPTPERDGV